MGRATIAAAVSGALALASGVAGAAPLNWQGTLTTTAGDLPPITLTGGGVATLNDSAGSIPAHLATLRLKGSRGNVAGTTTQIVTDPGITGNGIAAVVLEADVGTGTLAPISGGVQSALALTRSILPVRGVAKLCVLSTSCNDFVPLPLTVNGTRGIGIGGGQIAVASTVQSVQIHASLDGAPWTIHTASAMDQTDANTGTAAFQTVTRMGFAHGPASLTTSTADVGGVVQLVTPAQIRTTLAQGSNQKIGVLAELLVEFIPEPGLLLLLGSGITGLALLGRSRIQR